MSVPRQFPFFCPMCGTRVSLNPALCGNRLLDAIMLQADRLGVEIRCQHCSGTFIYSRLESLNRLRRMTESNGHAAGTEPNDSELERTQEPAAPSTAPVKARQAPVCVPISL